MSYILLFIVNYLFVFALYEIFIVRKAKKDKRKKPMEVKYLINKYDIDIKKLDYNKLLKIISLVSSLDITIVVFIAYFIRNYLLLIVVSLMLMIILLLVSYDIIGKYVRKKMIK